MEDLSAPARLTTLDAGVNVEQPLHRKLVTMTLPRLFAHLRGACLLLVSTLVAASAAKAGSPVAVPRPTHPGAGQVLYFVLTDRFANGSTANDRGGLPGGRDEHGFDPASIGHFHGGDFVGMTERLDYLQGLGVSAVWVTPPFKNKPVQADSAGYHGYWVLDFLQIDPHLGTNEEFAAFVRAARERGMRVFMDIIVNHTADVVVPAGGVLDYVDLATAPYRDAEGRVFDLREHAWNGIGEPVFPELSAERSFPYVPHVPAAEVGTKNPAWLEDVTLYHNRGNTTFSGENSLYGDFAGLDDLLTAHPRVVQGFIDVFTFWIESLGVDGFRIDTVKHVNAEFWQAFSPAIADAARRIGRPDFLQFAEVYSDAGDPEFLAEFSTHLPIDTALDFGFFVGARDFVSRGTGAAKLADLFTRDDYYTDHDGNVHATTTFLGNHDAGRFAWFLQRDNPKASLGALADLAKLGHGLLFLARGQPVIYYGDEQGMIGTGNDKLARESMFPAVAPEFRDLPLLATKRTGREDKFDSRHPFYRLFGELGRLRLAHAALARGAMLPRATGDDRVFAFSRIEREELVEYVVALNSARRARVNTRVPTSQPAGARMEMIFDSRRADRPTSVRYASVGTDGALEVSLAPLQFAVWRSERRLAAKSGDLSIAFAAPSPREVLTGTTREIDGWTYGGRAEIRADVSGGDGVAEVTFAMVRGSQPDRVELLGVDDTPPYRVFWRPPSDLASGETLSFLATVDDLRGRRASARIDELRAADDMLRSGAKGAVVPTIEQRLPERVDVRTGAELRLSVAASGTTPLLYQWIHDGREVEGATAPTLVVDPVQGRHAGRWSVLVRNRLGTVVGGETVVEVHGGPTASGTLDTVEAFPSRHVEARRVDVWLPPGYAVDSPLRYPVVYMHDGQNLFDPATSYGGVAWGVDAAMSRLIEAGRVPPAIVVGVWNTASRRAEYFPRKAVEQADLAKLPGLVAESVEAIRSDEYLRFLVEELKPYVDSHYRTRPEREATFVMGSSMGGLVSAYALAEHPDVFGGAGCVSTHWPAADGAVVELLRKTLPKPGVHRIYFDYGTETLDSTYEPYQVRMDRAMRTLGWRENADWLTRKFPGAEHSERSWAERVDVPLEFLLGPLSHAPRGEGR
jgi:glycosidase/predicted alpha/beta superfamily hydrolase